MKPKIMPVLFCLVFLAVSACGQQAGTTKTGTPPPAPTPEAGKATVTGRVYSSAVKGPIVTPVWLAEVFAGEADKYYILDQTNSPSHYTDENGYFIITNVKPQDYVIIVGQPEGANEVIRDETGKARIWTVPADQIFDVGQLKVALGK